MAQFMIYRMDTPTHVAVCLGELYPAESGAMPESLPAWEVERAIAAPAEYRASVSFFNGRFGERVAYFLRPNESAETDFEKERTRAIEAFNSDLGAKG